MLALDAVGQAALVRSGDVSAIELVDTAISEVERLNPEINAVVHPLFDRARETAATVTRRSPASPSC